MSAFATAGPVRSVTIQRKPQMAVRERLRIRRQNSRPAESSFRLSSNRAPAGSIGKSARPSRRHQTKRLRIPQRTRRPSASASDARSADSSSVFTRASGGVRQKVHKKMRNFPGQPPVLGVHVRSPSVSMRRVGRGVSKYHHSAQ